MNLKSNDKILRELNWDKQNPQFLQVKDVYCAEGKKLSPEKACFLSFLIFKSEKFAKNNPGIRTYIGYSNENLRLLYSKWFNVSSRTIREYIKELKNENLITIEEENTVNRRIYINYEVINPEMSFIDENKLIEEKDKKIEELLKQIKKLRTQNDELMDEIAKNEVTMKQENSIGQFTQILFDKKYLTVKDRLSRKDCDDYNAMLKDFLWKFRDSDKDFFHSLNYICKHANSKQIKNKFSYLITSLNNYLNRTTPDELWDLEDK